MYILDRLNSFHSVNALALRDNSAILYSGLHLQNLRISSGQTHNWPLLLHKVFGKCQIMTSLISPIICDVVLQNASRYPSAKQISKDPA